MSDAVVTLLAGLGGAMIGALSALGAQAAANKHQRREDRRREVVDLVARFWDAADRLWRSSEGLEIAVFSMTNAEHSGLPDEVFRTYDDRRIDSMAKQHAAETEGLFLIAQMRLLHRDVAGPAQALLDASLRYDLREREELRGKRRDALEAYEQAARRLLDRT